MPGRLYLKIFLSFIGVMVVAMFLVAGLFRHTEGEKFVGRFKQLARAQVAMVRMVVEDNIRLNESSPNALQTLVDKLGEAYMAKLWVTDGSGNVLAQSFSGPVPNPTPEDPSDADDYEVWSRKTGANVIKCDDDPHCIYVSIPFGGRDGIQPGAIHYYYQGTEEKHHEEGFFLGLVIICGVVALLIMPVSWLITRRLKRLKESARRIGSGDLSHRADIKGRDEVAGVGKALNGMADSLSRMIRAGRELTANVSHELRTPLTRMRIAEEMLRERFGEKGAAHLDSIREDIEALDKLIGKLLTLSKLDLKEAPFAIETVDMGELVATIADRLAPVAGHRSVAMAVDVPDNVFLQADGEAMHTALTSILENGVKHADEGGTLSAVLRKSGATVTLVTENTHPPLPEEELAAIFEPFRRARSTRSEGTGLGLAIAHKIIERHGGSVRAENCPAGIRFVVELPVD